MASRHKVVIIGLDGLTWKLIDPWLSEGKLPTLAKLKNEGVWGILESTIPPTTPTAWTSFATGKTPGKHGIFDFIQFRDRTFETTVVTSEDIKVDTFYEILSRNGYTSIIINLPLSFPPKEMNGIMVADLVSPDIWISPPELEDYIEGYRISRNWDIRGKEFGKEIVEDILEVENIRFELAKKLYQKQEWDLFFVLFSGTDWICHEFWFDIVSSTSLGKDAFKIFKFVDDAIDWFVKKTDENTTMILMSDHGFMGCTHNVDINIWLNDNGYLKIRETVPQLRSDVSPKVKEDGGNKTDRTQLPLPGFVKARALLIKTPKFRSMVRTLVKTTIEKITGETPSVILKKEKDIEKSLAFMPTLEAYGIYLNTKQKFAKGVLDDSTDNLNNLTNKLRLAKLPDTNIKIFRDVKPSHEMYDGKGIEKGPDILFVPNDGIFVTPEVNSESYYSKTERGAHDMHGIFIAYGREIRHGQIKQVKKLYDIIPTVLHMFNIPVPEDMDGCVITEIFKEDDEFSKKEIVYGPSIDTEKEIIQKAIRKLNGNF